MFCLGFFLLRNPPVYVNINNKEDRVLIDDILTYDSNSSYVLENGLIPEVRWTIKKMRKR